MVLRALVAQMVKKLPAMQETWIQFVGQDNLLEKGMATHSRILIVTLGAYKGLKLFESSKAFRFDARSSSSVWVVV